MPSLDSELKDKNVQKPEDELWVLGCEAWRKNTQTAAVAELLARVQDKPKLLRALVQHYFDTRIVPDMSGAALKESMRGGHTSCAESQGVGATPHGPVESGEATTVVPPGQHDLASPLSPSEDASATRYLPSGHWAPAEASSPVRVGTGHSPVVQNQMASARPYPKPNPPRGREAIALVQRFEDRSLFDTFRVRGNIPIGDLTIFEGDKIIAANERESRIISQLRNHVAGYVPPGAKYRDLIKPEILAQAIAQNMEMSDVR